MVEVTTPFCRECGEPQTEANHDHGHDDVWVEATFCDQCGWRYDSADPRDPDCIGCGSYGD